VRARFLEDAKTLGIDLADTDTIPAEARRLGLARRPRRVRRPRRRAAQGALMTPDLRCYGDDIQALADLVPDFDLRSPMDVQSWYRASGNISPSPSASPSNSPRRRRRCPTTADRAAAMTLDRPRRIRASLRAGVPASPTQARVQSAVIQAMTAAGHERGELWRVTADPTTLATGACYAEGGARCAPSTPTPRPATSARAGRARRRGPRARAAGRPRSCCTSGLSRGSTARASGDVGPGMRWTSPSAQPALEGLHVVAA
jgi:hypothetical protein